MALALALVSACGRSRADLPTAEAPDPPSPAAPPAPSFGPYVDPDDLPHPPPFPEAPAGLYPETCIVSLPSDLPGPKPWPASLAATGCFADAALRTPAAGMLPFRVRVPFFSAGAEKERLLALPQGQKLGFSLGGNWTVPVGTRALKTFTIAGRPVETRVLRLTEAGLEGATYQWNEAGTDAALLPEAALDTTVQGQSWYFPSRDECGKCHTAPAGQLLGLNTLQFNTNDQIASLAALGFLGGAPAQAGKDLPRLADPEAATLGLATRARSYLHANCAFCHQPGSTGNAEIDLRHDLPLAGTKLCNVDDMQGDLGVLDSKLMIPRAPGKSTLWLRMATSQRTLRMPSFSADIPDAKGAGLLSAWISRTQGCAP